MTDPQDYPKHAQAFLEKDKDHCLKQAKLIGSSTDKFLSGVLKQPSLLHQRKAQAILRLQEKYGSQRLEAACQRALSFENDSYRSLKGILRSEEHTSELQSLMRISYAVFCLKKKKTKIKYKNTNTISYSRNSDTNDTEKEKITHMT